MNIRAIVKVFRYYSTKNNLILPKYIRNQFGKELMKNLDTKTRWYSLSFMLERLLGLKDYINKVIIDLR